MHAIPAPLPGLHFRNTTGLTGATGPVNHTAPTEYTEMTDFTLNAYAVRRMWPLPFERLWNRFNDQRRLRRAQRQFMHSLAEVSVRNRNDSLSPGWKQRCWNAVITGHYAPIPVRPAVVISEKAAIANRLPLGLLRFVDWAYGLTRTWKE
jgi:hypothetical protein